MRPVRLPAGNGRYQTRTSSCPGFPILLDRFAWRAYRGAEFPAASWAVEDEALRALPRGPQVDLVSTERFRDFDLSLEWRLPPGGNSGVLYRVDEAAQAAWQSGPEMQLVEDRNPDSEVPETSCGALYDLYPPEVRVACSPGINLARITVHGSRVEHWLNGARVLACDLAGEDFRWRAARSKFAAYPDFARAAEGHIVLQHHGTEAWFREIRVVRSPAPR